MSADARRAAVLLGMLIALTIIGSSAVTVAVPVVRADLGLDVSSAAWIFAVFSLCFAVATAVFGRVADLAGLRTPLVVGVLLMAVGSAVVGLAPSLTVVLVGRVVQGIGSGAVPVLVNGIVAARWHGPVRSTLFGTLMAVVSIVSGSGPVIGGTVEALLGWRWVFALPALGLLLIVPIARLAPTERHGGELDVPGVIATSLAIAGLLGLVQAPTAGVRVGVVGLVLLALGVPLAAMRVRVRPKGFLPLAVLRNREIMRAGFAGLTLLAAYFAMLLAAPELLAGTRGWRPLQIGVALLPAAIMGAIASRWAGRAGPRIGHFRTARAAATAALVGLVIGALASASTVAIVLGLAGTAIGFGASQTVLIDRVSIVTPPDMLGASLGVFNLVVFVGGSLGTALVGGLSGVLGVSPSLAVLALLPLVAIAVLSPVGVPSAPDLLAGSGDDEQVH
jgi:MFS family permease